jgi:hypothetical protein
MMTSECKRSNSLQEVNHKINVPIAYGSFVHWSQDTQCDTFDLLSRSDNQGAGEWKDYSGDVDDPGLQRAILSGVVTFVYKKKDQETTIAPACEPTFNACSVLEMHPKSGQTGGLVSTKSLESGREAPWLVA